MRIKEEAQVSVEGNRKGSLLIGPIRAAAPGYSLIQVRLSAEIAEAADDKKRYKKTCGPGKHLV